MFKRSNPMLFAIKIVRINTNKKTVSSFEHTVRFLLHLVQTKANLITF